MSQRLGPSTHFGMDTITLAGPLEAKLRAMREAGFTQVMLKAHDLVGHAGGVDAAISAVRSSGLRVTGFQVLRDFEGLTGHLHRYRIDIAKGMLELAHAVGAPLLLVCSSTSRHASEDLDAIAHDLRKLAVLAQPLGIKVAYEGLSWGRTVSEFTTAWEVVCRVGASNLGPCIDSSHAFATQTSLDGLDRLDAAKVFLVQLSDFLWHEIASVDERIATARHFRVFPGEGVHNTQLVDLVARLAELGYHGDYSFEVFNDEYLQMPLSCVARRAHACARWLTEEVVHARTTGHGRHCDAAA